MNEIQFVSETVKESERWEPEVSKYCLVQRSKRTGETYGRNIRRFLKWLDAAQVSMAGSGQVICLETVGDPALKTYLDSLNLSDSSWNTHRSAIAGFMAWLRDNGREDVHPIRLKSKRINSRVFTKDGLTHEQAAMLVAAAEESSKRDAAIIHLLLATGMRVSEIVSLKRADLKKVNGVPTVTTVQKGGEKKRRSLSTRAMNAMNAYLHADGRSEVMVSKEIMRYGDAPKNELIFHQERDRSKPLDRTYVTSRISSLGRVAGLDVHVTAHTLRHTVGSWMAQSAKYGITDIQNRLGHKSVLTSQIYIHMKEDLDSSTADDLSSMY